MKAIWQDLRYGARRLIKTPAFTIVAVITLALGIGANTAIFTIVNAVLLRPLPYPESESLMLVGRSFTSTSTAPELSEPKFIFLRDNAQSFEAITAIQEVKPAPYLSDENETDYIRSIMVSADFFRVLGVQPASGRAFTSEEDSPTGERVAIIGDGLWRRRFGADSGIIGRKITLSGFPYTVVGIMPPDFEFFGSQDVLIPMRANPASTHEGHNWTGIGRLKRNVTASQAQAELKLLFDKFQTTYPRFVKENEMFNAVSWRTSMTSDIGSLLWISLGAVSLVLLIACANIANLQLARAIGRRKEMAIRIALGAGIWPLIRQLLAEGILLSLVGGLMGFLLARWGVGSMLAFAPEGMIPRAHEINPDWRVLAFTLGASLLTGIIFGLVPAPQILRVDVNQALKEGAGKAGSGVAASRLRNALVVIEIALALSLTVGAALLLRTFANLRGVNPGFEAQNMLTVEVSPRGKNYDTVAKIIDFYNRALERLSNIPEVEAVTLTNKLPLDTQFNLPYRLASHREMTGASQYRLISPDYFRVMKIAVQQGREFDETDRADSERVVIVNDAFVKSNFPDVDPVGQPLFVCCDPNGLAMHRIVGVVNDTKQKNLSDAAPQAVFIPVTQADNSVRTNLQQSSLVLRTAGDPSRLSDAVRAELRRLEPGLPIKDPRPMDELINRAVAPQWFNLFVMGLFATLGLALATVGIYGVLSYNVSQRTDEIGLRMALGAETRDVMKLILKQGVTLALIGIAIGLVASFALTRVIKSLLFNVSATDAITFIAVSLVLILVALLACWIPARRATKVDPIVALRYE